MTARKERNRWKAAGTLLLLATIMMSMAYAWASAGKSADASMPANAANRPAVPGGSRQPLENGPAVSPGSPVTSAPSLPELLDPHWSPNVRANNDTTTYAQQEPSVAINPQNHLNI